MILTVLSKVIGFSKELVLAFFLGANYITDAYIISLTIPQTIFGFIGASISTTFIPIYTAIKEKQGTEEASAFSSNLISLIILISSIIVMFVFQFTEQIVYVFASGFTSKAIILAVTFTRVSIFSIYFSGIIFVLSSYLQAEDKFISTGLITIPLNVITIVFIYVGAKYNLIFLAIGSVFATFFQLVILYIDIRKIRYKFRFIINFKDSNLRRMMFLSLPAILGSSVYQINVLIDRTIASSILEGGISILSYANRITVLIFTVFAVPIATVIYPSLSKMFTGKDLPEFKRTIRSTLNTIIILIIPSTIGLIIFSRNIVELLYGRGQFDNNAILLTSSVLIFYTVGIIGVSTREVFYRSFYAMQNTKTPLFNASISLVLNIVLNIVLSKFMGLNGLALATSISSIICSVLLASELRKAIGSLGMKQVFVTAFKVLVASLIMGGLAKLSFSYLDDVLSHNLSVLFSVFLGILYYIVIIYFMRIKDVDDIFKAIWKRN